MSLHLDVSEQTLGLGGFGAAGIDQVWSWGCTWERFMLGEGSYGALPGSGPWGLCFLSPSLLCIPGRAPSSRQGLSRWALDPLSADAGWAFQQAWLLITGEGIKIRAAVASNTFVQLQLFPSSQCFAVGSQPFEWGAVLRGCTPTQGWALRRAVAFPPCPLARSPSLSLSAGL